MSTRSAPRRLIGARIVSSSTGNHAAVGTSVAGSSAASGSATGTNGATWPSPDQSGRRNPVTGSDTPWSEWTVTPEVNALMARPSPR